MILELMVLAAAAGAPQDEPPVAPVSQEQVKQAGTTVEDALRKLRASDFPDWTPPPDKPETFPASPAPSSPPGTWVDTSDYPAVALRNNEEGRTGFSLAVGADGHVENCKVVLSSGYQDLDDATCQLIEERAQFRPAYDKNGNKVEGTYTNSVVWKIPPSPSPEPFKFIITYTVEQDGSVTGCKVIADEGLPAAQLAKASPCNQVRKLFPYLDANGNPVRKQVTISIINEVVDPPKR